MVKVFVEGYEDVAFWRSVFDEHEAEDLKFEIDVPPRGDFAKGKQVLMSMVEHSGENLLLCMDSDFDYLFEGYTAQSSIINSSPYIFHTYAYAIDNYLCYAPALHKICVKATKNDSKIFDFELFMSQYSETIFPVFLWYAYSARILNEKIFSLTEFRSTVKLNYLEIEENGRATLEWLGRQVSRRVGSLVEKFSEEALQLDDFAKQLEKRGVTKQNAYMFMQGHTLLDNVVMVALHNVCETLKRMTIGKIIGMGRLGQRSPQNELSNYTNAQRNVRDILINNEGYKDSPQYAGLHSDIERYISGLKEKK